MATGGAPGSQFLDVGSIFASFSCQKEATGHTVIQNVSKKLPKISDETRFKNNSKMSLIFWLLPPTPLPNPLEQAHPPIVKGPAAEGVSP